MKLKSKIARVISTLSILFMFFILIGCANNDKEESMNEKENVELTIAAAASLNEALTEIGQEYQNIHKNVKITYNFGGSGTLQKQIENGAPIDLFFSAAQDKFKELQKQGILETDLSADLLRNDLVMIVGNENNSLKNINDLTKASKIALGTPATVPAGQYGKQTLENLKLWSDVESKIVFAKDVRGVLTYVESGNVDAGFVYHTDALASKMVRVAATVSDGLHDPIIYPVGVMKDSKHKEEAKDFYQYLQSKEAIAVFEKYGFKGME